MARQGINTGFAPNDGNGDTLVDGAIKVNSNFSEIYSTFGDGTNLVSYVNNAGVSTVSGYSTSSGIATVSGYATIAGYSTSSGVSTTSDYAVISGYSTSSGIATVSGYATIAGYSTSSGVSTTSDYAVISGYSTSSGISTTASSLSSTANINTSGIITASSFVGDGSLLTNLPGNDNSGYATTAGIATYAVISGYSTSSGIATYATTAGIATYAVISGYSTSSGVSTVSGYSTSSGIATVSGYATISGYSTSSGVSTVSGYSTSSGVSTVSGYATIAGYSTSSGVSTVSGYSTSSGIATYATTAGIATASTANFTVGADLYVTGNISFGGTSVVLNAAQLQVKDRDIVVGYTTDGSNNDVSNDTTANHGGISVASTVGTPILNIPLQSGINSNPSTYKQWMWVKSGNYSGLGTDVWLSNYAVSIGNTTTVQNGSRLTVGTGFTVYDTYLDATDIKLRNINVTGISTTARLNVGTGGTVITTTVAGLVGIGTTNPQTKLQIDGVLGFTGSNIKIGDVSTGSSVSYGIAINNFFAGESAGQFTTDGTDNNFLGSQAGKNNTTGSSNNFLGYQAGYENTTGYSNNFIGDFAGYSNIDGFGNNFLGAAAGTSNISGYYNHFSGVYAGYANTTGNNNVYIGYAAGSNETGSENVIIGSDQSTPILNGSNQLVIGAVSGTWINGNSSYNVGIGTTNPTSKLTVAGTALITGITTTARLNVGTGGTVITTTVAGSVGIGTTNPTNTLTVYGPNATIRINDTANNASTTIAYGSITLNSNGVIQQIGDTQYFRAGQNGSSSYYFDNYYSGFSHELFYIDTNGSIRAAGDAKITGITTTARLNVGTGGTVITTTTAGSVGIGTTNPQTKLEIDGILGFTGDNIRIGNQTTGPSITTGQFNFFVGNNTGLNNTDGNNNNFLGAESGSDNTSGSYNNFLGYYAGLFNTTGDNNNFFGLSAGISNDTGSYNNFIGDFAGNSNTTGSYNIYVGTSAGSDNETGSENVVIGKYQQAPILNGSNQLVIGAGSTSWITGNSSYNVGIGTTNPTTTLQVQGTVSVSSTTTSSEFVGGGSDLRNISGTHLVSYASASDISNSALSIAGISTYNQVGILTGSLAVDTNDRFGQSVATSADGKTIIVGTINDEIGATAGTGVVYVYDRVGSSFNQVGILTGSLAVNANDFFGYSVATSADGKTIIVGAYNDEIGANASSGVVYVYDRVGSSFNQVGILTGSFAVDAIDYFGFSVATSADGKTIVVGAPQDEIGATLDTGIAYVFDRVGNSFNQVGILTGSLAVDAGDNFGISVATSADGKTIVVGAYNDEIGATTSTGVVYVYDRVGSSFNQVGILTGSLAVNANDFFGISVATSADGKTIIVGAPQDEIGATLDTGIAYVFDRVGSSFNQVGILTGSLAVDAGDFFGQSVATSADGKTIIVGAHFDEIGATTSTGVAYIFKRQGNSFNQVGILTGSLAVNAGDRFGISVATSADGKTIIVGAHFDEIGANTSTGIVYVFDETRDTYVYSGPTGNIGIGTASPAVSLDLKSKTDAIALPQGTTAQRPTGNNPYIRWNTTNSALEFYNGTDWVEIISDYFPSGSTILG